MSRFSSDQSKDKNMFSKKSQFYVEFLGWMECRGVRGRQYTDPIIRELQHRQKKMGKPPKLTIQLTRKDVKISQEFEEDKRKRGAIKKIKFPTIPARDVTFAAQATRPDGKLDDVVACIYLGYMPRTQRYVHVHVYRFDEPATAATFARLMSIIIEDNASRIDNIEKDLLDKGEIDDPRLLLQSPDGMSDPRTGSDSATGSASSAYSEDGSPTFGSDEMDADMQSLNEVQPFDSVAEELKYRLKVGEVPLLLPPKDYDTISRARGNLKDINQRRCLNLNIIGEGAVKDVAAASNLPENHHGSDESGIDLAPPTSDATSTRVLDFPVANPVNNNSLPTTSGPPLQPNFVYPPRQTPLSPKISDKSYPYPSAPAPAVSHARQSSQSSAYSTHSSRASQHSDDNNENVVVYRGAGSHSSASPPAHYDDIVPPRDYFNVVDTFDKEPALARHNAYVMPQPLQRQTSNDRLMQSLPTRVLQNDLAFSGPKRDEVYYNAHRNSQPLNNRSSQGESRPRSTSATEPGGVRRANSLYR